MTSFWPWYIYPPIFIQFAFSFHHFWLWSPKSQGPTWAWMNPFRNLAPVLWLSTNFFGNEWAWSGVSLAFLFFCLFSFIFVSWRLITLQYCSGFCHTLTWISHVFTCVPHPEPPSHLPPHWFSHSLFQISFLENSSFVLISCLWELWARRLRPISLLF